MWTHHLCKFEGPSNYDKSVFLHTLFFEEKREIVIFLFKKIYP